MPVAVLYPRNRQLSSRVRVFAPWLRNIFEAGEEREEREWVRAMRLFA
jgi:hypothetical protein